MKGTLKLNKNTYNIEDTDTRLYLFKSDVNDGTLTISADIYFQDGQYDDMDVSPFICINEHETNVTDINQMVGMKFLVNNVSEANEREDTFYLFEHEPLKNYQMTILEVKNDEAHLEIKGVAITDGYTEPYKAEEFMIDCWLPVPKI